MAPTLDPSLTEAQLAAVPVAQVNEDTIARPMGPCGALCDTLKRNIGLWLLCIVLWGLGGTAIYFWLHPGAEGRGWGAEVPLTMVFAFFYFVYLGSVAGPALCCARRGLARDRPLDSLSAPAVGDIRAAAAHLRSLQAAAPRLELTVTCFHTVVDDDDDGASYSPNHHDHGHHRHRHHRSLRVVTFSQRVPLPIARWRDISPDPGLFVDAVIRRGPAYLSLAYEADYELPPGQEALLAEYRERHARLHRHRDEYCEVGIDYVVPGHVEARVDNIADTHSARYTTGRMLHNWPVLAASVVTTLYPWYIVMWKLIQTPLRYKSVKHLHIARDMP
jgi:hypothetical protein